MIDWKSTEGEIIAIISDIHSNKRALQAAIKIVKEKPYDKLIILGDILSYGIDVQEVLDIVSNEILNGALLLKGNHDEIYLDLLLGNNNFLSKLKPFLQETISYTLDKINIKQFSEWNWQEQLIIDNIYFSHANPYGNLWDYIKTPENFHNAALQIKELNYLAGVFGHSHRNACYSLNNGFLSNINGLENDIFIINPGSVGQPRGTTSSILRLSSHNDRLWAETEQVQYDIQGHIDDLSNSTLSDMTKNKLIEFFVKE